MNNYDRPNSRPIMTHMLRGNILANKLKEDGEDLSLIQGKLSEWVKLSLKESLGFKNIFFLGGCSVSSALTT